MARRLRSGIALLVFRPLRLRHPTKLAKAVHCGKVFRAKLGNRPSIPAASWVDMTHEALD